MSIAPPRVITRKSAREIDAMREAGRIVAEVLDRLSDALHPGMTTAELDTLAEQHIRAKGATPSFKGYRGYPSSICVSIDDEVVHGMPGPRRIREGQVVSIDAGVIWHGYHGDGARTFIVGAVPVEVRHLVETTKAALLAGIAAALPGNRIWDISAAVEDVALGGGYGIVRNYVGHGIGQRMHEEPQVPNFRSNGRGIELASGLCLAIEPMLTLGSHEVEVKADGWTVVTKDGSVAAHFEHTIAITADGSEVLTVR